jgi:undecaprenyl-diphosphatase
MLGAIAVAALSAVLTLHEARWYLGPIYRLATRIHFLLFGKLIALGWVRE